ncbi:MAG: tRNA lysidine(34) synthetase TilS [Bacteroidaceae bacterium]|nr:tRNA lysidine(34) synthetase TilS [Bacteroidaceae bacterium]
MKHRVKQYIEKHHLLSSGDIVLVGVSGGADSVALLHILLDLGYKIEALHCNFQLRGEESDRDEAFVDTLCQNLNIPIFIKHFSTAEYASEHRISIEMAARDLRYEWFREMKTLLGAQCIAVAHHKDDQAETLMLNLVRGTGMRGLAGMYPKNGDIIRPFLCLNKREILNYLKEIGQEYTTDSTNLERETLRNVIRLDIMPRLEQLNPQAIENLANTARIMQESWPYYQESIETHMQQMGITPNKGALASFTPTLLHEWLYGKGFSATQEKEILSVASDGTGKRWESMNYQLLLDRGYLLLEERGENESSTELITEYVDSMTDQGSDVAYLDAEKILMPLTMRKTQKGDRFVPFGMTGFKLVSDFLTDLKCSLFEKQRQQVVCSGEDIVWVVGRRSDNRYRITPSTKKILKLRININ